MIHFSVLFFFFSSSIDSIKGHGMLYRTAHQMIKVSRASEDRELELLLNMLRMGWRITNVISLPTNKTAVYFRRRVWCRPIRFLLRASVVLSSRKRSYAVKRG